MVEVADVAVGLELDVAVVVDAVVEVADVGRRWTADRFVAAVVVGRLVADSWDRRGVDKPG